MTESQEPETVELDAGTTGPAAAQQTEYLIEIDDLCLTRGEKVVFDHLSLKVPRGGITAVMGPSGTGKTTLLRVIGGQVRPDSGAVYLNGKDVCRMSRSELFEARRDIGMLFQSSALFTDINVFENVAFPMRVHTDLPEDTIRDLVIMKLNAVGLRGARDLMPSQLSGGMARRVALARAIALDPDLIMYDEPFTGQDPISMGVILTLIRQLNEALGTSSLLVSHDIHETVEIADYVFVLADGKVIGEGPPKKLREHPSRRVTQFMRGDPDGPVPFHYPADDLKYDLLSEDV